MKKTQPKRKTTLKKTAKAKKVVKTKKATRLTQKKQPPQKVIPKKRKVNSRKKTISVKKLLSQKRTSANKKSINLKAKMASKKRSTPKKKVATKKSLKKNLQSRAPSLQNLKIALVHDFLVRPGGAERVLQVMADMFPKAPIYTLVYDEKKMGRLFPPERVRTSSLQKWRLGKKRLYRFFLSKIPRIVEDWDFAEYDLVISSSNSFVHGIVVPLNTTHISYCHSPMRYAWDHTHEYMREHKLNGLKGLFVQSILKRVRMLDRMASDRPDVYIANSDHIRKRIAKYYRRDAEVIHPPVDVSRFKPTKKHEDYFLILSQLSPYKRVDLAVQAFNKTGKRLVIIGSGPQEQYLRSIAGPNIEILGWKPDSEVNEYMRYCRGVLFPGEDDFGIVPVEAMASGKPVLAYGHGGALETVIPGVTGELFEEPTVRSLERGLARFILNEKKYKPMTIRKHAEQFSIDEFKRKLRKLLKEKVGK